MPILKKLKEMLDQAQVSYEAYTHPLAYTAQEIAEKQHVSGKEMAKVVMLEGRRCSRDGRDCGKFQDSLKYGQGKSGRLRS
jgi:hypothetical protein